MSLRIPTGPVRLREAEGGRTLRLEEGALLGTGGEARVFAHPHDPALVVKVYHEHRPERIRKLAVMRAAPPDDPMRERGHVSIAWPAGLVVDDGGAVAGFVMPRLDGGSLRVFELYNPKTRRRKAPLFHWQYLHRAARNVAQVFAAVHARGYVVGDVNESNVLVSDRALVTLVDCDSFQVRDPASGAVLRCRVGKPEYTPPELHGVGFADVDRTEAHDRFGLAVLLFHLLMEGTHPFTGRWIRPGDPPELAERIRRGWFPHAGDPDVPLVPARLSPSLDILHPGLQALFRRAFTAGHAVPSARPAAAEWRDALLEAERALAHCRANPQHLYGGHLPSCTWCARAALLHGRDAFPTPTAVAAGEHLHGHRTPDPGRASPSHRPGSSAPASSARWSQTQMAQHFMTNPPAWAKPGTAATSGGGGRPTPAPSPLRPPRIPGAAPSSLLRHPWLGAALDAMRQANGAQILSFGLVCVGAFLGDPGRSICWMGALLFGAGGGLIAHLSARTTGGASALGFVPASLLVIAVALGVGAARGPEAGGEEPGVPETGVGGLGIAQASPSADPSTMSLDLNRLGVVAQAEATAGRHWLAAEALDSARSVMRAAEALPDSQPWMGSARVQLAMVEAWVRTRCEGEAAGRPASTLSCPGRPADDALAALAGTRIAAADSLRAARFTYAAFEEMREAAAMLRDLERRGGDPTALEALWAAHGRVQRETVALCGDPKVSCPPRWRM